MVSVSDGAGGQSVWGDGLPGGLCGGQASCLRVSGSARGRSGLKMSGVDVVKADTLDEVQTEPLVGALGGLPAVRVSLVEGVREELLWNGLVERYTAAHK